MKQTKVNWLIENFSEENYYNPLKEEVKKLGHHAEFTNYIPFEGGTYNQFKDDDCVVFHGSIQLARQLNKQKKWFPLMWLTEANYLCSTYYAHLGKYIFNKDYVILPRDEVKRRKEWLMDIFKSESIFIRPNSAMKEFTGHVINIKDFQNNDWQWIEMDTQPETLVVVSSNKVITDEWRFVCIDSQIITGSWYKNKEYRNVDKSKNENDKKAWKLAQRIAGNKFKPDSIYVIDICLD